jgi:hypothetical protein
MCPAKLWVKIFIPFTYIPNNRAHRFAGPLVPDYG